MTPGDNLLLSFSRAAKFENKMKARSPKIGLVDCCLELELKWKGLVMQCEVVQMQTSWIRSDRSNTHLCKESPHRANGSTWEAFSMATLGCMERQTVFVEHSLYREAVTEKAGLNARLSG